MVTGTADSIAAIAVLSDTLRRNLYEFIRRQRRPVSRDEAAEHAGISRKLAAFHLDKLTHIGLLRSNCAPREGAVRRPGRRPKLYEPADGEFVVSVPQRHYDLLGEILVAALEQPPPDDARQAALRAAAGKGAALGAAARRESRLRNLGPERALTAAADVLATLGYEPHRESPARLCLHNCPFHRLAKQSPELVCGLNHAFVAGLLRGLRTSSVGADLTPAEGHCCVTVHTEPQ